MNPARIMTRWLWLVGVAIVLAGILFGYDEGVISGALLGIEHTFSVSTFMIEVITSWVTLGALVGALVAGTLADGLGRRRTVRLAAVMFTIGAIVQGLAPDPAVLVAGRLIVGFGIGIASVATPLFASEMTPAGLRGRFISSYQFGITFGVFVAYFVDELLQSGSQWRLMLAGSAVLGIMLLLIMLPMTDTPRWYLRMGRQEQARAALARVQPSDVDAGLAAMQADDPPGRAQATWRDVLSVQWRAPLKIGIGLAIFQQVTGINAIIYYADTIFAAAGFTSVAGQTAATTWAIGGVNVLATLIAVAFVDRLGRRPLLVAGLIGMAVSLTVVGIAFMSIPDVPTGVSSGANATGPSDAGIITLVALVVYIASFAFSLGPVVCTMINEIFPRAIRSRAVAVSTAAIWLSAWLVSQFFLSLINGIGESATFWLFAVLCVVCLGWVWKKVPETKGLSLEQIEQMWARRQN